MFTRLGIRSQFRAILIGAMLLTLLNCTAPKDGSDHPAIQADGATERSAFVTVNYLEGKVEAEENGRLRQLVIGDQLSQQVTVHTGADGRLELELNGLGLIIVQANTSFRIDRFAGGRLVASDLAGKVLAKVNKLGPSDSLIIKAPAAACGVRGTIFLVNVEADGTSSFAVHEGLVAVFPNAAVDHGWVQSSMGAGNRLEISYFPQLGADQRLSIKTSDTTLRALQIRLEQEQSDSPESGLDAALDWLKVPLQRIQDLEKHELETLILLPTRKGPTASAVAQSSIVWGFRAD